MNFHASDFGLASGFIGAMSVRTSALAGADHLHSRTGPGRYFGNSLLQTAQRAKGDLRKSHECKRPQAVCKPAAAHGLHVQIVNLHYSDKIAASILSDCSHLWASWSAMLIGPSIGS